jgi:hypothetical protein
VRLAQKTEDKDKISQEKDIDTTRQKDKGKNKTRRDKTRQDKKKDKTKRQKTKNKGEEKTRNEDKAEIGSKYRLV